MESESRSLELVPKILAAASPQGHRIELLEYCDGKIVIMFDGVEHAVYPIGNSVETCIKFFLGLHRSCGVAENG
jgi:hypothetical protein